MSEAESGIDGQSWVVAYDAGQIHIIELGGRFIARFNDRDEAIRAVACHNAMQLIPRGRYWISAKQIIETLESKMEEAKRDKKYLRANVRNLKAKLDRQRKRFSTKLKNLASAPAEA